MAIALPLEIELRHGDHRLGTIVVDVPLETSGPRHDDEGNLYVDIKPPTAQAITDALDATLHVATIE